MNKNPAIRRIVLILSVFPQLSETFIVNKFLGLIKNGWDVHVVCSNNVQREWKSYPELSKLPGVHKRVYRSWQVNPRLLAVLLYPFAILKVLYTNPGGFFHYLRRGFLRYGWDILRRFFLDFQVIALKPDLIHFEFGTMAAERADLNHLLDCKEIVSFRGYDLNFSGLDQQGYYDKVWKHADGFHFLGMDLRKRAIKRGCPPEKPFALIPPAIDTEFFDPASKEREDYSGDEPQPLRILSVGRLEWKKGYEYALQAIRLLIDRGGSCEYRIVGGGSYLPALAYARHQLGLEDVVEFSGALSRQGVLEKYKWADVFLHAAVSEGFCNAVLEAQAMQLPVVCTDADGLAENVEHDVTGYVVPRRNVAALAEKLALLAGDNELRQRMGLAGRQRMAERFIIDKQIQAFGDFYMNTLDILP